jgi:hypothetical protein
MLINCGHRPFAYRFPAHMNEEVRRKGLLQRLGVPADCATEDWTIQVNATKDFSLEQLLQARQIIVDSRIFPIWHVAEVKADSYKKWQEASLKQPKTSRVVFEGQQGPLE